jgi:hypothetical protein
MDNCKTVVLSEAHIHLGGDPPTQQQHIVKTSKERTKRIITETKRWDFTAEELEYANQLKILYTFHSSFPPNANDHTQMTVCSQIKVKLRSYKEQDIKKNIYDPSKFITFNYIIAKMKECELMCYYCHQPTNILYEYVREPKQWTVERLDNTYGHNCDNVEIACLTCNVRRKTTFFEKYIHTKKLCGTVVKLG